MATLCTNGPLVTQIPVASYGALDYLEYPCVSRVGEGLGCVRAWQQAPLPILAFGTHVCTTVFIYHPIHQDNMNPEKSAFVSLLEVCIWLLLYPATLQGGVSL